MTAPILISVPGAPVAKGRPRFSRKSGSVFTPGKTRTYEDTVRLAAGDVMAGRPPIDGPVIMRVSAFLAIPKSWSRKKQAAALVGELLPTGKPDADNFLKAAGDSLNTIVFRDDSQIVSVFVEKRYSDRPRLDIKVERLGAAA